MFYDAPPLPPVSEIHLHIEEPVYTDQFNALHDRFAFFLDQLQQEEIAESFDAQNLEKLKQIFIDFARLGSAHASEEDLFYLDKDILELKFDFNAMDCDCCGDPVLCKNFFAHVRHIAHKIAKFVRHHKKEILIGAVVVAGIGVIAYAVSHDSQNPTIEIPPVEDPPTPSIEQSSQETPEPQETLPKKEPLCSANDFSLDPAFKAEVMRSPLPLDLPTPVWSEKVKEKTKDLSSFLLHELWSGMDDIGTPINLIFDGLEALCPHFILEIAPPVNAMSHEEAWRNYIDAGHKKIDELFSTQWAHAYEGGKKPSDQFVSGEIPPPWGLFSKAKDVAVLSKSIVKEGAVLMEGLSLANKEISQVKKVAELEGRVAAVAKGALEIKPPLLNPIRMNPNGIWEIEGKVIKKFDLDKMMDRNRIKHIFENPEHNLEKLKLTPQTTYEKITEKILEKDLAGNILEGQPFDLSILINGNEVQVRGIVINGELNYSTLFIPKN